MELLRLSCWFASFLETPKRKVGINADISHHTAAKLRNIYMLKHMVMWSNINFGSSQRERVSNASMMDSEMCTSMYSRVMGTAAYMNTEWYIHQHHHDVMIYPLGYTVSQGLWAAASFHVFYLQGRHLHNRQRSLHTCSGVNLVDVVSRYFNMLST